jgi:hypothetical protein
MIRRTENDREQTERERAVFILSIKKEEEALHQVLHHD